MTAAAAAAAARDRYAMWAIDVAAGAASGLALYWLPKSDRKGLALYFFTRSGEFLARFLSSHRLLPPLLERLAPHVDVALMTLSASQILFSYIMERDTLDPTYSSFLIKFGGKDVRVIDSIAPLRKGGKLNRAMFMEWAREHQLKDVMGVLFGLHHYKICDVVHPESDCVTHFTGFTYEAFWRAFPMYATLHSLTTIIFLLSKLRSFVVTHGYHRRCHTRPSPREGISTEPATISIDEKTQSPLAADSTTVEDDRDGGLALHRDDSMRALHWSPSPSRRMRTRAHLGVEQEQEEQERRKLSAGEVGRMVSYSVSNLCAYLRTPSHVWALLRFVFSQVLPKLILNIVRSSLFLGLYCASGWLGACLAQRSFLMKDVRWFYPVLALPGLASIIEVPTRRRELALYCLPKAMESCYAVCKKYDVIPRWLQYFKNGEVFLFSVGSALTLFCYVNGKESIKPTFLSLMNWLWA
jgi:hypothetical protein